MKILCFADIHESLTSRRKIEALIKKEKPDVIVCAGDFTVFEQHLEQMMDWMHKLPTIVALINGNHEEEAVVKKMSSHRQNILFLPKKPTRVNGVLFVGAGGGGFDVVDRAFEQYVRDIEPLIKGTEKVVLVTHGPPQGCKLDYLYREHVGNKSYTNFIKKHNNVVLAISGHLHENFEKEDTINKARAINPGPNGKIVTI